MTKHTQRDRMWSAALETAEERRDAPRWRRRFGATVVQENMDDPASTRSLRDLLATMADLGHLERASAQGKYVPIEEQDESPSTKDQKISSGPSTSTSRTTSAPSSSSRLSGSDAALAMEAEPVSEDDEEDGQEDSSVDVSDLDLPGDGSTLEARRDAVRACYEFLREEGTATKADFIENLYHGVHTARYGSEGGWWNAIGKQGLRELARIRDDVAPPASEGAHIWEYTG